MGAAGVIADFELPARLEAAEPPEARGLRRDEVRLLVSTIETDSIEHARFSDLPRWLAAGDLLVVNTSGTLNAALPATTDQGIALELHLSTRLPGGFWSVEVRQPGDTASLPYHGTLAGTILRLPAGGRATVLAPYPALDALDSRSRLWLAALQLPCPLVDYLGRHGFPIRYGYVPQAWPGSMYQTVFATEPGSAEMPSAGRPFSDELVTRLVSRGIQIAPLLLHTGVASQEDHEPPYEEFYRVPRQTAERVNAARHAGSRVIAVGTTVVRALETVTDDSGFTAPGEGWTSLVITPDRPLRAVTGLITGLHEAKATHLAMLERLVAVAFDGPAQTRALAGVRARRHLQRAYDEARRRGYLWHEFGDSHLIIARFARART
ncbi:MAG TPA: S-adenosylmethionine:tRNA ribosyltransferase-isomerase [Vicinamibacterales bacterium]|nr:S-adenosylmethionine:tRNA ribosyltransferase-isomerase [Vicinamibacterales bacterium]